MAVPSWISWETISLLRLLIPWVFGGSCTEQVAIEIRGISSVHASYIQVHASTSVWYFTMFLVELFSSMSTYGSAPFVTGFQRLRLVRQFLHSSARGIHGIPGQQVPIAVVRLVSTSDPRDSAHPDRLILGPRKSTESEQS